MKKTTAQVAVEAGALVVLVSLVDLLFSISADHVAEPMAEIGVTLGAILMGWGTYSTFAMHEHPGMQAREDMERARAARHL